MAPDIYTIVTRTYTYIIIRDVYVRLSTILALWERTQNRAIRVVRFVYMMCLPTKPNEGRKGRSNKQEEL